MELQTAFSILGVKPDCNTGELSRAFRSAVKQYHPDFNAERLDWSHEMMTRLNSAYAVATEHLKTRRQPTPKPPPQTRNPEFDQVFPSYCDQVIEALYTYYQYGLDNLHLRKEGNLRFRYRSSLKKLLRAAEKLTQLKAMQLSRREEHELAGYLGFAVAFLRCAKGGVVFIPSLGTFETKAHRHYEHATQLLDNAVKRAFFDTHFRTPPNALSRDSLATCEQELLILRGGYAESRYFEDAAHKLRLLERLEFLLKL